MNRTKAEPIKFGIDKTSYYFYMKPNRPMVNVNGKFKNHPTRVRFELYDDGELVLTAHLFQGDRRTLYKYDVEHLTQPDAEKFIRHFAQVAYFTDYLKSEKFSRSNN